MSLGCTASSEALDRVTNLAVTVGGHTHWEPAPREALSLSNTRNSYGGASSTHIEMTGYGLMAMLAAGRVGEAFPVARWLVEQRNSLGGFSSTQDTAVALEALGVYSAAISAAAAELTVTATAPGGFSETLTIDSANFDILQRRELPLGGPVEITVSGSGVGLMQLTTMFHEDASNTQASYSVDTEWSNVTGADLVDMQAEACVKAADGALEAAGDPGMVLITIGCFTGYTPTAESLKALTKHPQVDRADVSPSGGSAEIYLSQLTNHELCLTFHARRTSVVYELKPAMSKAQAYYKDSMVGVTKTPAAATKQTGVIKLAGGSGGIPEEGSEESDSSASGMSARPLEGVAFICLALALLGLLHL